MELGFNVTSYKLSDSIWESLAMAKEGSRSTHYENDLGGTDFCGHVFNVSRGAAQRYNYILHNNDLSLKINKEARGGLYFPELYITLRSAYLWRNSWQETVARVIKWVNTWAEIREVHVSRVDITADFRCGLPVLSQDLRELVIRARNKTEHQGSCDKRLRGLKITGYTAGSSNLLCRIYDKTEEIKTSNKAWFKELWATKGWQEGATVTRVEFQ